MGIFSTVPSAFCATSTTAAPAMGRPAGSRSRTAYDSPHPSDTGSRTSSTRGEPSKRGGVAFGVAASGGGALATCLDGAGARGLGRTVALGLARPLPPVAAFGGALVCLGGVLASRAGVLVSWGGMLGSCGVAVSLSASRGDTDFVLAGPPAEGDSLAGRGRGGIFGGGRRGSAAPRIFGDPRQFAPGENPLGLARG